MKPDPFNSYPFWNRLVGLTLVLAGPAIVFQYFGIELTEEQIEFFLGFASVLLILAFLLRRKR